MRSLKNFKKNDVTPLLKKYNALTTKKNINANAFTLENIKIATKRAKETHINEEGWPAHCPSASVFKLVEDALNYAKR